MYQMIVGNQKLHSREKELANDIMDELTAIGLQKRSIYSKDTTLADEKYPDGSKSDYFSVQIAAKENNILEL